MDKLIVFSCQPSRGECCWNFYLNCSPYMDKLNCVFLSTLWARRSSVTGTIWMRSSSFLWRTFDTSHDQCKWICCQRNFMILNFKSCSATMWCLSWPWRQCDVRTYFEHRMGVFCPCHDPLSIYFGEIPDWQIYISITFCFDDNDRVGVHMWTVRSPEEKIIFRDIQANHYRYVLKTLGTSNEASPILQGLSVKGVEN